MKNIRGFRRSPIRAEQDLQIQMRQVGQQVIGVAGFQISIRRNSGPDGDGLNAVLLRGANVLWGIADQRYLCVCVDPAFLTRSGNRQLREATANPIASISEPR